MNLNKFHLNILKLLLSLLALNIAVKQTFGQNEISVPSGMTLIRNKYAYMADKGLLAPFITDCINQRYSSTIKRPSCLSIETMINYIERLEDFLSNTTDPVLSKIKQPGDVARLLLQRFHLDDIDFADMEYSVVGQNRLEIDTKILGNSKLFGNEYYFPDQIYNQEELCAMLFMFSHVFLNASDNQMNRYRRDVYHFDQSFNNNNNGLGFNVNNGYNTLQQYAIQEKGVVSFRLNKQEAIAPAKILIGILTGTTKNFELNGKNILGNPNLQITFKDPLIVLTLANMVGTAFFHRTPLINYKYDEKLTFGIDGLWMDNRYLLKDQIQSLETLRFSSRGSLAQLRGALDGYIIGKHLRNIDTSGLRLTTILRSYYSTPHSRSGKTQNLGVSYCDRSIEKPAQTELDSEIDNYAGIFSSKTDQRLDDLRKELFQSAFDRTTSQNDFCRTRPSGTLDQNAPSETPSDLLFIVDSKQNKLNQTSQIINDIIMKINKINRYAGSISVFVNSNSNKNLLHLPNGPGGWPLSPLVFNETDIGSVSCAFKQDNLMFSTQQNFGKFFKELNETISNYRYWNGKRKSMNDLSSINVIVIDYDTLKLSTDSKDSDDYRHYKDSLKYDNRDVKYFIISNNKKDFVDILPDKNGKDYQFNPSSSFQQLNLQTKIGENPAQIIYEKCYEKKSENEIMTKHITPGYKQQWAMYPEYFLKSFHIEFKIQAIDGSIRYCFDREFPPRERAEYCKELNAGSSETLEWNDPCKHQSLRSCDPFYFTIWGKERTVDQPCKDIECQSLDQIKFQIQHTGISCNSSMKLLSMLSLQIVCFVLFYRRFINFM